MYKVFRAASDHYSSILRSVMHSHVVRSPLEGAGLFIEEDAARGDLIIENSGKLICVKESDSRE